MSFYILSLIKKSWIIIVWWFIPLVVSAQAGADFEYQLTGDKRIAPVQVFDDGNNTYLQFRAGQVTPAIFTSVSTSIPVAYEVQGPYVVVEGTHPELQLRLQQISATVKYMGSGVRGIKHIESSIPESSITAAPTFDQTISLSPSVEPVNSSFDILLSDANLRLALARWAAQEGWIFTTELWQVPVDMPITATAKFNGDFKQAVRAVLRATELSSHPLQPCFYSNKVLRVVPFSERCDRSRSAQ